jgi:hypothetical protein
VVLLAASVSHAVGQTAADVAAYNVLLDRLETQEAEIRALREHLDQGLSVATFEGPGKPDFAASEVSREGGLQMLPSLAADDKVAKPSPADDKGAKPSPAAKSAAAEKKPDYTAEYKNGFLIRSTDLSERPFELKVNGWIQFRHVGFDRDVDSWTDHAGITRPVRSQNYFEIERGRIIFSGYALSPELKYFLHLDGDTDGGESVDFFDYWWSYKFADWLDLQMGKRKAPGSRQWLLTARRTRLADRPMADDFFRPDRTTGLFAIGELGENIHYELMVGDGYRTANIPPEGIDKHFAYAATAYWDPLGDYGEQIVDFERSDQLVARLGHSFTYSAQESPHDQPLGEADFVRLTDGTRLLQPSALAPGVTVSAFDTSLYSIDVAAKWRGWSVDAEYFFRWIGDISGDGALPLDHLFDHGFFVEGGYFLCPKHLDMNVRYSQVDGLFGNSSEIAVGFDWYPLDTYKLKVTLDVTSIDSSPVQSTSADILAGDDGTLFRTQLQAEF